MIDHPGGGANAMAESHRRAARLLATMAFAEHTGSGDRSPFQSEARVFEMAEAVTADALAKCLRDEGMCLPADVIETVRRDAVLAFRDRWEELKRLVPQ
ncbi:hypothetical protein [Devosia sp.]|uniref:hypothetical protein n=1 Tax=Devosia sp. TaxID=1871048 RepID=UPI0035B2D527